jgi:hypothetical protein
VHCHLGAVRQLGWHLVVSAAVVLVALARAGALKLERPRLGAAVAANESQI